MSGDEIAAIKEQIRFRKSIDDIIGNGSLYRLKSPFDTNYCVYEIVSRDKSEIYLFSCRKTAVAQSKDARVKLLALDETAIYTDADGNEYAGDLLTRRGIRFNYGNGDYATAVTVLKRL